MISNLILVIYAATSSAGLIFLKMGSEEGPLVSISNGRLHFNPDPLVFLGVFLYGLSFIIYTYLVSKNDLGYIVPISTALVYVFIFIGSFIIFKEAFTAIKVAGIALILIGVLLLNISK